MGLREIGFLVFSSLWWMLICCWLSDKASRDDSASPVWPYAVGTVIGLLPLGLANDYRQFFVFGELTLETDCHPAAYSRI